jgi:hypothetical protein
MKEYRPIIILAVVAALLAGIYFFFNQTAEPIQNGKLFSFSTSEGVIEILVTNSYGSFTFSKESGQWRLTQPGQYRVNQQKAAVMESYLVDLPINRALDRELAEYGFSHPFARISFVTTQGRRKSFLVGNQTPSKAQVYLKDLQGGKIYVSDIGVVSQFDGSLEAFRDKEIFSIDKANIAKLTYFKNGKKELVVEQVNSRDWRFSYPIQAPARFIELNEFVVKIRNWISAGYPADKNLDLQAIGLASPTQGLEVVDRSGRVQQLDFGKTEGGMMYVRTGSNQDIVNLYAVDVDFSMLNVESLIFVTPLKTTIDQVAEIDLKYSGRKVRLEVDHSKAPVAITSNKAEIPYGEFISFFVAYLNLSADGFDSTGKAGAQEMVFTTTFTDNSSKTLRLLNRDAASLYMGIDGKTEFYLSREKVAQLFDRLETALAASK